MREHPTSRGDSQGVRAWGEGMEEGLCSVKVLNQLASPSFCAEQDSDCRKGREGEQVPKMARCWSSNRGHAVMTCSMV